MISGNIYVFLGVAVALTVLALVMLLLATQHDKVVALAPMIEEERAVQARIDEKRKTLGDLEQELEKRREALANVADIQAEVDALVRKKDDLLHEWAQLESRRAEVQALRHETEAARNEKLAADAELATARAELDEVREKLVRADELVHRIDALQKEKEEIEGQVEELREQRRDLEDAEARVSQLAEEAKRLTIEKAEIEGRIAARTAELSEIEDRLASARSAASEIQEQIDKANAELAAARQRASEVAEETAAAADRISTLEARKAVLEREIEKARNVASGAEPDVEDDPLKELKQQPQVVARLVSWTQSGIEVEAEALKRVKRRFDALGLTYPDRTLRAFHTAMKVNDTTQMAVLAGISGTGKSQLPRQYAAGMGIGFLQVPVQPRWDSPQDLMGFYNYIEGRFRPTDMARALYALDEQNNPDHAVKDRMLMILLDEMNLARVEYYFSDFLSRLESRPARGQEGEANLRKDAEIELEIPKKHVRVFPGYNLLFAGTMNEDESTQSLSDKVVDRANVIRFGAPKQIAKAQVAAPLEPEEALSKRVWDRWCKRGPQPADRQRAETQVQDMLALMQEFGKPFGHRLGRAILAYVSAYPEVEGMTDSVNMALADQVEMRLLPKLRGVDVEEKRPQFDRLQRLASDLGDEPLGDAIKHSVEAAEATGQFIWRGVTR